MPLALPFCSNLIAAAGSAATALRIEDDSTEVCADIELPGHFFGTIYTATLSERIMVTACNYPLLTVTRGADSSTARDWPAGACFKLDTFVGGNVCPDVDTSAPSECPDVFDQLTLGKGLVINRDDPTAPVLELAPTGVVAGDIGGANVNACGQITSYPANWPASALPVFSPCCDDDVDGGGAVDACSVAYTAQVGGPIVTSATVCEALVQLEDAIYNVSASADGVLAVTAGDCISIGGTAGNPTVSVSPSGINPGTYDGFDVNVCGQITGYTPPANGVTSITGNDPLTVANVNGGVTISIGQAAAGVQGTVELINIADVDNEPNLVGTSVVTWEFFEAYQLLHPHSIVTAQVPLVATFDGTNAYDITATVADPALITSPAAETTTDLVDIAYLRAWAASRTPPIVP